MWFVDFKKGEKSRAIDLIFPGWQEGETVAFLSPHDDDVLLGAGYLLLATILNHGNPLLFIFCQGDAGYSAEKQKDSIVRRRRIETIQAYGTLGLREQNILFFDIPDFSLMTQVNRDIFRRKGLFEEQVRIFRKEQVSRVVFSSGNYEHWDHTAAYYMGIYTSPQAGDSILADLGKPFRVKSYYIYSVWGDFEPLESKKETIRADKGILADKDVEEKIRAAVQCFESQQRIFQKIVSFREKRKSTQGYLELYREEKVRKQVDFQIYHSILHKMLS